MLISAIDAYYDHKAKDDNVVVMIVDEVDEEPHNADVHVVLYAHSQPHMDKLTFCFPSRLVLIKLVIL